MINIRHKTDDEIKEEESLYRFGAQIAKGIPKDVCPTYLVKRDGTRVDTWDLTEDQILGLIQIDLVDFTSPKGNYKKDGRSDLDTFKLIDAIKKHYKPSIEATIKLASLQPEYGHIIADIIGSIGCAKYFSDAKTIATFNKEASGDFDKVSDYEVLEVLEQMAINEKNRKNANTRRK